MEMLKSHNLNSQNLKLKFRTLSIFRNRDLGVITGKLEKIIKLFNKAIFLLLAHLLLHV